MYNLGYGRALAEFAADGPPCALLTRAKVLHVLAFRVGVLAMMQDASTAVELRGDGQKWVRRSWTSTHGLDYSLLFLLNCF
jgi:hypothetical protein